MCFKKGPLTLCLQTVPNVQKINETDKTAKKNQRCMTKNSRDL